MITDIEKAIRDYLQTVLHLSLATVVDNKPWVSELHFVFDDDLNLYFRSKLSRRHSLEIETNHNVAGNIIEQHGLQDKVRGVYFEGEAQVIEVVENDNVYQLFVERLGASGNIIADAQKPEGHKFYKISVEKFYLFDGRESSPAEKHELPWNN